MGYYAMFLIIFMMMMMFATTAIQGASSTKIKKIVVLMEENRSYDHFFGFNPFGNGLTGKEFNVVNTKQENSTRVGVDEFQPEIAICDPDHGTAATTSKVFGMAALSRNDTSNPTMSGFVEWENHRGNNGTNNNFCKVMSMMTPQHVPVMTALASEFGSMDRFFASVPGPTWPNRLYMLSATSAGCTSTGTFYDDKRLHLYPQRTIFDQLNAEGMTWRHYYNDTPWEMFLESLVKNVEHIRGMEQFYEDARTGNLPQFSWINPRAGMNETTKQPSNDQHPDHDVSAGEAYYKDIYEALRASPDWENILYIVTYDEHGGFYDHVPTPVNVPPPDDHPSYPLADYKFDRLGVRIPCLLISPWIPKGTILSAPPAAQKPALNSEYSLTSIIATVRVLLGMKSGPLTKRDAWSATFEQVFSLDSPRTDCPLHLPDPPPSSLGFSIDREALMPLNDLQKDIMSMHATLANVPYPHHITQARCFPEAYNLLP
eukprot:TRINITY_DN11403_c0_g1_i2.p1 TRINITY_DN11403_c0_g1~~TRINITY_DN11403_c0_g1_i2.p1  ORF type:complete len:512 (-),score=97.08 TRINITY_DN11403_c0_g1_i2:89-1546(-)